MSLADILPQPKNNVSFKAPKPPSISEVRGVVDIPPYGKRKGFVPRRVEDFGDGGAFPEIDVLQYPLNMGNQEVRGSSTAVVPLEVDAEGNVMYDAILRQGMRKTQKVYSQHSDLVPKEVSEDTLAKPSAEEEQKIAERTREALSKIIDKKIAAAQPTHVNTQGKNEPVFIRYTPSQAATNDTHNSGAKQRIIRLQEMPKDPLEPPKFRHQKLPNSSGSPPVPVMHSPPRKLTAQDQQNWKIPPCVSNWKNIKGYTIPLDKRLAADGRGLQETQVNSKFAKLSESLYIAEQTSREEIQKRALMQQRMARQQKQAKEVELRKLAEQLRTTARRTTDARAEDEDTIDARAERDEIRQERLQAAKRDMRMSHMGTDAKAKLKKVRDEAERDVSEKIALGQQVKGSADMMFDQRLFNQDSGLNHGYGADDSYSLYDKPLFKGSSANQMYRPSKDVGGEADIGETGDGVASMLEKSTSKFKADREFKGTEAARSSGPRTKPVEFERDDSDPFGLGDFLTEKPKKNALDAIGKQGHMSATGGASHGMEYSRSMDDRNVEFQASREDSDRARKRARRDAD